MDLSHSMPQRLQNMVKKKKKNKKQQQKKNSGLENLFLFHFICVVKILTVFFRSYFFLLHDLLQ